MPQEDSYQVAAVDYTDAEISYRDKLIQRMENARMQRQSTWTELNDQNYLTYYETNAKAANSYIRPKENKDDTRVVTGTTEEKENTLISAVLNYNLEASILAHDTNDVEISELGDNMADLVRKSREIEDYDGKRPLILKELFDQGDCYVEEVWCEEYTVEKETDMDLSDGVKVKGKKMPKGKFKKSYEGCRSNLLPGTSVFLGNMRQFHIQKQPYVFTVATIPYEEAKSIYQGWERFEYVPKKVVKFVSDGSKSIRYQNWTLVEVAEDMVEVIKYYDRYTNEFMIMLNGVMMLPIEFPLTVISPSGDYPLAKGSIEPISEFFALSKSIPAKTKVDQATFDEMFKLLILKTQQSYKPPMANNTKRILSYNLWSPGTIHRDIDTTKLTPIIAPTGVTASEFNAMQFIKQIIDAKSVSPVFSGETMQGNQTATQILEMKKQQMMKLGMTIWGVISLEKQLAWLRLNNILTNWTKPVDEKVDELKQEIVKTYRTVSMETDLSSGVKGTKIIEFNPEMANMMEPENVEAEEEFMSKEMGKPVKKVYFDPEMLRNIKAKWYINVTPTEKDTTELQRVLFTQNIKDAAAIFGPQSLNMEYLKERFAVLAKENPDKFFAKAPSPMEGMGGAGAPQGDIAAQMMKAVQGTPATQQPSLNALIKA